MEKPSKPTDSQLNGAFFVKKAIDDIRQHVEKARGNYDNIVKKDTFFFQLVRGGSVDLVSQIVEHVKDNNMKEEMSWALGLDQAVLGSDAESTQQRRLVYRMCHQVRRVLRIVVLLVLWIMFAITTPVFYILHAVFCGTLSKFIGGISKSPQLSFAYAVFSEKADMVHLFLQYGTSPRCTDRRGNTVYHYLADMSAEDPDKFKRCHQLLKGAVDNSKHSLLIDILANQENDMGMSPLEFLVLRGSIAVFIHLTREECCLGRLKVAVSRNQVTTQSADDRDIFITHSNLSSNTFLHQGGKSASVNRLGNTVASGGRNPIFGSEDLSDSSKFQLVQWEFDVTKYEQKDIYKKQSLLLHFLVARDIQGMDEAEVTALGNSSLLHAWMDTKKRAIAWCFLLKYLLYITVFVSLLCVAVSLDTSALNVDLAIPYLHALMSIYRSLIDKGTDKLTLTAPNGTLMDFYCQEEYIIAGNRSLTGCEYAALQEINKSCRSDIEFFIKNTGLFNDDNSQEARANLLFLAVVGLAVLYLLADFVQRTMFLSRKFFNGGSFKASLLSVFGTRLSGSYADRVLNTALCCVLLSRYWWMRASDARLDEILGEVDAVVEQRAQGTLTQSEYSNLITNYSNESIQMQEGDIRLLCSCLLISVVSALHSLRLVPMVSFFILTCKKMGSHCMEFGVVYGLVTVIFAVIFCFIMRDDACPAKKMEGFQSIGSCLFVVYTLSVGGDANNAFLHSNSVNARLAFIVYTLISIMLLLNLIIAVMTTTADELNRPPWKKALCIMELWDEMLGVEALRLSLSTPVLAAIHWLRTKTGAAQYPPEAQSERVLIPVTYNL